MFFDCLKTHFTETVYFHSLSGLSLGIVNEQAKKPHKERSKERYRYWSKPVSNGVEIGVPALLTY